MLGCLDCSWDNIVQAKTLCNVVQEAPDNITQEKLQCYVVLILLGQHCTGKPLCNVVLEASDNIADGAEFKHSEHYYLFCVL